MKFNFLKAGFLFTSCIAALLGGCTDNTITQPEQVVFPEANVSYAQHVAPFITVSCSFSGCHGSDAANFGSFSMVSFFDLYMRAGLIKPYDPDNSTLNQVLERRLPHRQGIGAGIIDNHVKGMRQWVLEGGKNN